jgi:hypothetical protein
LFLSHNNGENVRSFWTVHDFGLALTMKVRTSKVLGSWLCTIIPIIPSVVQGLAADGDAGHSLAVVHVQFAAPRLASHRRQ